ncbi:MAG: glycogen/starch synthase, partial [Planctomycetota bacterium]|nr:glycogen/starch synthase [Planctomycetota bacterium]
MRVLMLGWEFPPLITGGLGTACAGLTRALVDQGVEIDFVLPRPVESRVVDGVRVLSPGCEELTS